MRRLGLGLIILSCVGSVCLMWAVPWTGFIFTAVAAFGVIMALRDVR